MKKLLLVLSTILFQILLHAQTNIYVSNNGTNMGQSLPTLNNPVKTLEQAYVYIENNLVNSNNEATSPINVFLKDDGGEILVSSTHTRTLDWEISGTYSNPITISSYIGRATLTRSEDFVEPMLDLNNVNHIYIRNIDFNKVVSGAIQLDNSNYNEIMYCSFHGDGSEIANQKVGVIWIGANEVYNGPGSESSSFNKVSHNIIYDLKIETADTINAPQPHQHQGIYLSRGAHNNIVSYNSIHAMPGQGILGNHIDYKNNYISSNLISRKNIMDDQLVSGVYLTKELKNNESSNSIANNIVKNNYVYDAENSSGVHISSGLPPSNSVNPNENYHFSNRYPSDPYWLGYDATKITDRMVSGDFDEDDIEDDIAAFYDYSNQTKIHVWQSKNDANSFEYSSSNGWWQGTSVTPSTITKRIVVGDFDNDGHKDDIAAIHKGTTGTGILVWRSDGSKFLADEVWWQYRTWYNADKVTGRVVSGDFDEDGWEDDIAAFWDYGNNLTRIHVWRSNGVDGFDYQGSTTQWTGSNYSASAITGRLVSGDFDDDTFSDDIAAFYDNGNSNTTLNVWTFDKVDFFEKETWWNVSGYNVNMITGRVVSGDFDDNGIDDIAAFYDYSNNNTRIHTWLSSGTHISYRGSQGWWSEQNNGYSAQNITGRVVSGDFNGDGETDISAFNDFSSVLGNIRSHVWHSNGVDSFDYINQSLGYPWLTSFSYYSDNNLNLRAGINLSSAGEARDFFIFYPNPTDDGVQFEFKDNPISIEVFDFSGQLLLAEKVFTENHFIDVSYFTSGMYFYKVIYKDKTVEGKFMVD